jgi:hypothetical protein
MIFGKFSRASALALVAAFATLTACDSPIEPQPHADPVGAEVYLRGTDQRLAYIHGDHWHGSIALGVGEEIEVDVRFLDDHGHVIPLGGEYTVRAEIAAGHPTDIISIAEHGDHLDIEGEALGETRIVLHLWHGNHSDWSAPALRVVVHEPEPQPVTAEVYLRGTDTRLAYVDNDHWHGLIELDVGEEIEVDVRFLDAADQVIPLGGEYTVHAEIAPGYPEGLISIEEHGDHLDIDGEAAGETRILLHFWHDGHADWTTPALRVVVNEPAPAPAVAGR